jgi:hypothetical protein
MANDNTGLLILLGIAGYVLISQNQSASGLPYMYPSSSTPAKGGGSGGGAGVTGSISSGSPQGTPGTSTNPASGSNPQTAQQGSGAPFGPPNPATDACNQASDSYNAILCTNEGGTEYWESGGIVQMPTTPVSATPNQTAACIDDGDPCNTSGCSYSEDACIASFESSTGVDTGDDSGEF